MQRFMIKTIVMVSCIYDIYIYIYIYIYCVMYSIEFQQIRLSFKVNVLNMF